MFILYPRMTVKNIFHSFIHSFIQSRPRILGQWCSGVSMFDFHSSDRGLDPGLGSKISCLQLHYSAAALASVSETISHRFTQAMMEIGHSVVYMTKHKIEL